MTKKEIEKKKHVSIIRDKSSHQDYNKKEVVQNN